jgi:hypothetical protein
MSTSMGRNDVQRWPGTVDDEVVRAVPRLLELMTAAWTESEQAARVALLERCCAPSITYTNPLAAVEGIDGVAALLGQIRAQYPGMLPVRTTAIDLHHQHGRYGWAMRNGAGQTALIGQNLITLDQTPLIQSVISFLGPLPRITYTYGSTVVPSA